MVDNLLPFLALSAGLWLAASALVWQPLLRTSAITEPPKRAVAVILVITLALASIGLYRLVGHPVALRYQPPARAAVSKAAPDSGDAVPIAEAPPVQGGQVGQPQVEAMVSRLSQRLQAQPNDPDGWRMLIKSYETLGRLDQAAEAYKHLLSVQKPDAALLVDYAVTLGISKHHTLAGEPEALLAQALQLDGNHVQALALSGNAAFERQDYEQAIKHWRKLLSVLPTDAELRPAIEANLAKAETLGKTKGVSLKRQSLP